MPAVRALLCEASAPWERLRATPRIVEIDPLLAAMPEGGKALGWAVCIDLYPFTASPLYDQVAAGTPCHFMVQTTWDGARLTGQLFDRRSVGAGDRAVVRPLVPFVDGYSIRMKVPAELLGTPTSFLWSTFTEELVAADAQDQLGALGPCAGSHVDAAPDGGVGAPLAWPGS